MEEKKEDLLQENEEIKNENVETEEVSLEEKIKELEMENLRLRADMENLRKRAFKEKTEFARYANENLLGEIIPVCDNFERATQVNVNDPDMEKFLKGFRMIQDQLDYVLKNAGLEKIQASGQKFDPNFHEASEVVEDSDAEEGTIIEVMRTGYKFGEKIVRPALVKVKK
jgi:molecular chaperone GrpE